MRRQQGPADRAAHRAVGARVARIMLIAALAGGVVACEGEEDELDWQANELMEDTLSDAATPPPGSAAEGLTVTLTEWNIRLASDTVPAGPARIRVRNIGEYPHVLEIEGNGREWVTAEIPADEWATLEVDLQPGTYELYCPLDDEHGDHSEQGMVAYLHVQPGAGGGSGADAPAPAGAPAPVDRPVTPDTGHSGG